MKVNSKFSILTLTFHEKYINKCIDSIIYLKRVITSEPLPLELILVITKLMWNFRSEPVLVLTHGPQDTHINNLKCKILEIYPDTKICVISFINAIRNSFTINMATPNHLMFEPQLISGYLWDKSLKDTRINLETNIYIPCPATDLTTDLISWFRRTITDTKFIETQNMSF